MGGGTIRAAAKVGGIAAATSGFRVSSAARKASSACPPATAAENVKVVASNLEAGVQRPVDGWVFAGGEEDEVVASADEPIPRVVFGGAPSLQEAQEATFELTLAFEKGFLSSPNSVKNKGSFVADKDSSLSLLNKPIIETEACVASEDAVMAFRVLHGSPMAQTIVASIASDPNVWKAVLQNKDVQKFVHSEEACSFSDENLNTKSIDDSDLLDDSSEKLIDDSDSLDDSSEKSTDGPSKPRNKCVDVFRKIKCTVVDMMNYLSDYFQSFFGGGKGVDEVFVDSDGSGRLSSGTIMEASFIGLAVMAIIVVLLKRNHHSP